MRIIRTWSGVARIRMLVISELMQLDLPAPVAPAMSRWGIVARLTLNGRPAMSRPRPDLQGVDRAGLAPSSATRMSPRFTNWRWRFGTSTPMALRPGIGAMIRTSGLAMA